MIRRSHQTRLLERDGRADVTRVARYLRGRVEFGVRPDDLFISSYPRSGTTWLQHIAHALRSGGDVSFDHIGHVVPWFERSLALGRCRAAALESLPSPRVFKSHLPRSWLPRGARYLYIERDGRDVAVSYYHFHRSHLGFTGSFEEFFECFLRGNLQYRSWFKHVAGWRSSASDPAQLTLRYESLRDDLAGALDRIATFWGVPLSDELRSRLLEVCGFAFMKEHQAKFDHAEAEPTRSGVQRGQFIRRGESGAFSELLSREQEAQFSKRLRPPSLRAALELDLPAFLH